MVSTNRPSQASRVSRQTISLLERDEYTPSIIIALKISQIFNETVESVFRLEGGRVMNKYKVNSHYVVAMALFKVSVFLLIGMDLGWFNPMSKDQFISGTYFTLIPVVEWIEKKSKNLASEKENEYEKKRNVDCYF